MDRDIPATRNEIAAQKTRNLVSSDKFVEPNRVGVEGNHNINDLGDIQRVVCVCVCVCVCVDRTHFWCTLCPGIEEQSGSRRFRRQTVTSAQPFLPLVTSYSATFLPCFIVAASRYEWRLLERWP